MSKFGVSFVSFCAGLVAGLLLGYTLLPQGDRTLPAAHGSSVDTSAPQQFFYRVNDSTLTRHTVSGTGSAIVHTVDTVAITRK